MRKVESAEYMLAQLTSVVANTGFRSFEDPTKPTDYMPSQWNKVTPPAVAQTTQAERDKRLADAMRMFFVREGHEAVPD